MCLSYTWSTQLPLFSSRCANVHTSLPHPFLHLCLVRGGETGQTVTYLYYLILLFQITCIPAFCNTLFFRQFTVKLIRLQLSSSTFQSCKYALITLITLGYFPSLHQQHIYNHVFVLSHSQSHSEPISKFPGHLTQPGLWLHLFLKFDLFCQGPIIDSFFFPQGIDSITTAFALQTYFHKQSELKKV